MKSAIYIPTRNRVEYLIRSLKSWIGYGIPIIVVSDSQHRSVIKEAYSKSNFPWEGVEVLWIRNRDRGIGFARNKMVEDADDRGLSSFIMADDDHVVSGDVPGLLKFASRKDVVGVGAFKSIYRLFTGDNEMTRSGKAKKNQSYLIYSSGYQVFALNRKNMVKIEGVDESLTYYEDQEIRINSITQLKIPWFIYTGVAANGVPNRIAQTVGGISTFPKPRDVLKRQSHEILYKRWPDYISDPSTGRQYRCNWKKMLGDFIPGLSWPVENISAGDRPFDWRPR